MSEKTQKEKEQEMKEFQEITKPVIKYLNDNFHPHVTVIITTNRAELVEGLKGFTTNEFVKD